MLARDDDDFLPFVLALNLNMVLLWYAMKENILITLAFPSFRNSNFDLTTDKTEKA